MKLKFWGVRGSIPTPLSPERFKSKVASIVQRARCSDLESPESRERFIKRLPDYIFDIIGGNTSCVEIRTQRGDCIILDAGSGIRELGLSINRRSEKINLFHIFFTHFHWDHIQGLPFFLPILNKENKIIFYSPVKDFETYLHKQTGYPYFPIKMSDMNVDIVFKHISNEKVIIGDTTLIWKKMDHPGGSVAYRISEGKKSIIFATDIEIKQKDFQKVAENINFFKNADILILDSQYTLEESINKLDWGHTSYSMAVDFATEWGIKKLFLFHHEPKYNDRKVYAMLRSARWYISHLNAQQDIQVYIATEGTELEL